MKFVSLGSSMLVGFYAHVQHFRWLAWVFCAIYADEWCGRPMQLPIAPSYSQGVQIGSTVSVRRTIQTGSEFSSVDVAWIRSSSSVLGYMPSGSRISLREGFGWMGSQYSIFSAVQMGGDVSAFDEGSLGSSLSVHSGSDQNRSRCLRIWIKSVWI